MKKCISATLALGSDNQMVQNWPLIYSEGIPHLVLLGDEKTEEILVLKLNRERIQETDPTDKVPLCYLGVITPDDHLSFLHKTADFADQL